MTARAGGMCFPDYGPAPGKAVADGTLDELAYYADAARRMLSDPARRAWWMNERIRLAAIEFEMGRKQCRNRKR